MSGRDDQPVRIVITPVDAEAERLLLAEAEQLVAEGVLVWVEDETADQETPR
jgi:hypothetical protein